MSEGPISRERAATTATPMPRIRKGDVVRWLGETEPVTRWTVVETDHVTARLRNADGWECRRYVRELEKLAPEPGDAT